MIEAKFYQKPGKGSIHMIVKGHAESAPKGEDLICASATMLAYTVAQAVRFMQGQGKLVKQPKILIESGEATVIATPTEDAYAELLHTYWVAQCGFHVLSHSYPQNVKLEHLKV